ncbi:hypothetical protein EA473_08805 [Natrarchaeobius chitinivorans]|uniref:Uncharacterized protein n=1 Tax=Natrarchaeobius chitinivorans TaxID=1679083 RepID=A0A3N6M1H0_NATCH|nr:hypothetical protein EA473_08805 [Natrarchaeobius chitinivorans]
MARSPPHPKELSAVKYRIRRIVFRVVVSGIALSIIAAQPALADDVLCDTEQLPELVSGFFQITTTLGIVGLVVVWQADSFMEMFTASPEQKRGLKQHKRSALKSAVILLILGPLYTVAASVMGLPLGDCINLVPW